MSDQVATTDSARRAEILAFIVDHQKAHGYPPTVREIGRAVGLTSTSTVHVHLAILQRQGAITHVPGQARTLKVVFS